MQKPPKSYEGVDNWTDVDGSTQAISASGDHMWEVANSGVQWVRFVWTSTSGSGTVTSARCNMKGV